MEDPLDRDRPIIDPHHHLWDRPGQRYLVDELHLDTGAGHNIVKTVFVECMAAYRPDGPAHLRPVGETEFVAAQADAARDGGGAEIAGIVAFADLTLGDAVEEVLEAHHVAGRGLFRGIRHAVGWHESPEIKSSHTSPPPGLMNDHRFRAGLRRLGALGFVYDAWQYHPQLDELVDLARACPDVTIVVDHLGGPMGIGPYQGRREEVLASWRPPMAALAASDNVVLKLGGIGMARYFGGGWPDLDAPPSSAELADHWGTVLTWCIDTFGPQRCMFESNFPVDRESCSYVVLWNTFKRVAAEYSQAEKRQLFQDTAARVYDL